jgi:hypothetical protein
LEMLGGYDTIQVVKKNGYTKLQKWSTQTIFSTK